MKFTNSVKRIGNAGFSLVEAIVAFAIAAIAGVAVVGFMQSGSKFYTKTSNDVGLQYEQQMVVNRIRDILSEASNAVTYDDAKKTLYVYNSDTKFDASVNAMVNTYEVDRITLSQEAGSDSGSLVFAKKDDYTARADVKTDDLWAEGVDTTLLGDCVKSIEYKLDEIEKGKITFTIEFISGEKEIKSTQIVYLRNKISDGTGDIYEPEGTREESFVKSIIISRGDTQFPQNGLDTIKLVTEPAVGDEAAPEAINSVSVQYNAKIITKSEYSERAYSVVWSLTSSSTSADVTYASVDPATGLVTINNVDGVDSVSFILKATLVDDPRKYQTLNIRVETGGVYPKSIAFAPGVPDSVTEIGCKKYEIHPIITYTDGSTANDCSLCTWEGMDELPDGVSFFPEQNLLTATSLANDEVVRLVATLKETNVEGKHLSAVLEFTIKDVPEYATKQKLSIAGTSTKYNNRADTVYIGAMWENAEDSQFDYYWTIEPYGDNWGDTALNNFDKNIHIVTNAKDYNHVANRSLKTDKNNPRIYILIEPGLNWNKQFKFKVKLYAEETKTKLLYGNGNQKDKNYTGPLESIVVIDPVTIYLQPASTITYNNANVPFATDKVLKLSNKRYDSITYDDQIKAGNPVRQYRFDVRGLNYTKASDTGKNWYFIPDAANNKYSPTWDEQYKVVDTFSSTYYDSVYKQKSGYNLARQFKFGDGKSTNGFYLEMLNNSQFNTAYNSQDVRLMKVKYTYSDKLGNKLDALFRPSDNDDEAVKFDDYYYEILYDVKNKELN